MVLETTCVLVHVKLVFVQTPVKVPAAGGVPVIGYVTITLVPPVKVMEPAVRAGAPVGVPTVKPVTPLNTRSAAANEMVVLVNEVLLVSFTLKDAPATANDGI